MFDTLDPYCDDYHKIPTRDMTKKSGIASSSSMPKIQGCLKSSCHEPLPRLPQNHLTIKDDDFSTSEITHKGGQNCLECLECCSKLFPLPEVVGTEAIREMKGLATKLEKLSNRLISFCSLLPPDYLFDKDKIIQLWVAQGVFDHKCGRRMEVVANEHFEDLLRKNFIVQSRFDWVRRRMKYKVGNVVSSSSYVSVQEAELDGIDANVKHLLLISKKFDRSTFRTLERFNRLHTLLFFCQLGDSIKQVPYDLFPKLKHLRILDLHATNIYQLPENISCLSSLHYLDVSDTPLRLLPESICSLQHLQTLKLENCFDFYSLPLCTSKLVSLRHLDLKIVGRLTSMPVGMGKLTSLQTLKGFILGKGEGYGAGELKHLTDLCGSFCMSRLENISSAEEAREVEINKKHLSKLEFQWQGKQDDMALLEEILECLQPHSSLKELQISFYDGSRFPTWMSNSYLSNIVSISLVECINCNYLPSLGGLPSLKSLNFYNMDGVKSIDHHFCTQEGSRNGPAFPKLEELNINQMPKLEKWIGVKSGDFPCLVQLSVSGCPKLSAIPMLSLVGCLKNLEICGCDELQSFPEGKLPSTLELLVIIRCPLVKKRCCKPQGEDWSKIEHIPSIFIDHQEMSSTDEAKYGS